MITAAALTLPHLRPSVTSVSATPPLRLRTTAVTCDYSIKVTIYNCRRSVVPRKWPLRDLMEFGALPGAVPCARLHTRLVLAEWGLTGLSEQAELVVSELMTNAVTASRSLDWVTSVRLWMLSDRAQVMIAVWDANPHLRAQVEADDLAESGRGLRLVDAITAHWDAYATPQAGGKVVRAVIHAESLYGRTGSS